MQGGDCGTLVTEKGKAWRTPSERVCPHIWRNYGDYDKVIFGNVREFVKRWSWEELPVHGDWLGGGEGWRW